MVRASIASIPSHAGTPAERRPSYAFAYNKETTAPGFTWEGLWEQAESLATCDSGAAFKRDYTKACALASSEWARKHAMVVEDAARGNGGGTQAEDGHYTSFVQHCRATLEAAYEAVLSADAETTFHPGSDAGNGGSDGDGTSPQQYAVLRAWADKEEAAAFSFAIPDGVLFFAGVDPGFARRYLRVLGVLRATVGLCSSPAFPSPLGAPPLACQVTIKGVRVLAVATVPLPRASAAEGVHTVFGAAPTLLREVKARLGSVLLADPPPDAADDLGCVAGSDGRLYLMPYWPARAVDEDDDDGCNGGPVVDAVSFCDCVYACGGAGDVADDGEAVTRIRPEVAAMLRSEEEEGDEEEGGGGGGRVPLSLRSRYHRYLHHRLFDCVIKGVLFALPEDHAIGTTPDSPLLDCRPFPDREHSAATSAASYVTGSAAGGGGGSAACSNRMGDGSFIIRVFLEGTGDGPIDEALRADESFTTFISALCDPAYGDYYVRVTSKQGGLPDPDLLAALMHDEGLPVQCFGLLYAVLYRVWLALDTRFRVATDGGGPPPRPHTPAASTPASDSLPATPTEFAAAAAAAAAAPPTSVLHIKEVIVTSLEAVTVEMLARTMKQVSPLFFRSQFYGSEAAPQLFPASLPPLETHEEVREELRKDRSARLLDSANQMLHQCISSETAAACALVVAEKYRILPRFGAPVLPPTAHIRRGVAKRCCELLGVHLAMGQVASFNAGGKARLIRKYAVSEGAAAAAAAASGGGVGDGVLTPVYSRLLSEFQPAPLFLSLRRVVHERLPRGGEEGGVVKSPLTPLLASLGEYIRTGREAEGGSGGGGDEDDEETAVLREVRSLFAGRCCAVAEHALRVMFDRLLEEEADREQERGEAGGGGGNVLLGGSTSTSSPPSAGTAQHRVAALRREVAAAAEGWLAAGAGDPAGAAAAGLLPQLTLLRVCTLGAVALEAAATVVMGAGAAVPPSLPAAHLVPEVLSRLEAAGAGAEAEAPSAATAALLHARVSSAFLLWRSAAPSALAAHLTVPEAAETDEALLAAAAAGGSTGADCGALEAGMVLAWEAATAATRAGEPEAAVADALRAAHELSWLRLLASERTARALPLPAASAWTGAHCGSVHSAAAAAAPPPAEGRRRQTRSASLNPVVVAALARTCPTAAYAADFASLAAMRAVAAAPAASIDVLQASLERLQRLFLKPNGATAGVRNALGVALVRAGRAAAACDAFDAVARSTGAAVQGGPAHSPTARIPRTRHLTPQPLVAAYLNRGAVSLGVGSAGRDMAALSFTHAMQAAKSGTAECDVALARACLGLLGEERAEAAAAAAAAEGKGDGEAEESEENEEVQMVEAPCDGGLDLVVRCLCEGGRELLAMGVVREVAREDEKEKERYAKMMANHTHIQFRRSQQHPTSSSDASKKTGASTNNRFTAAACTLQKFFREKLQRMRYEEHPHSPHSLRDSALPPFSFPFLFSLLPPSHQCRNASSIPPHSDLKEGTTVVSGRHMAGYKARKELGKQRQAEEDRRLSAARDAKRRTEAALRIQKVWRGMLARVWLAEVMPRLIVARNRRVMQQETAARRRRVDQEKRALQSVLGHGGGGADGAGAGALVSLFIPRGYPKSLPPVRLKSGGGGGGGGGGGMGRSEGGGVVAYSGAAGRLGVGGGGSLGTDAGGGCGVAGGGGKYKHVRQKAAKVALSRLLHRSRNVGSYVPE